MSRWGMVIDIKKCVSCYACVIACKQEYFLPPGVFFNKVLVNEVGEYPNAKKSPLPVLCNHCKNALCVEVCPTSASSKRDDGIVVIDPDKCTGCQHCELSCPYNQRSYFDGDRREFFPGQGKTELEEIGELLCPHQDGTMMKCEFCKTRIDNGIQKGLKPGIDKEASPACVNVCMCRARIFGDLDDPYSNVSVLIRERNGYCLHPEYDAEPAVFYIE